MDDSERLVRLTGRGETASKAWVPVTRGARRAAGAPDPRRAELLAWQAVLPPRARFTHLTAARIHGWWLPPLPAAEPVFVAVDQPIRIRRPGLVAIRRTRPVEPVEVDGLRVDPPAAALSACARDLGTLDLTCLADAVRRAGQATVETLLAAAGRGSRGRGRLILAIERSDWRADSIWEVLLRELHRSCDIEVVPQRVLLDGTGTFVARGDLWLVGTTAFHEYDGADHLARRQQRKDLKRDGRIEGQAWTRRGYTREDVLHQGVAILRDADRVLGREHDPARIRAWHDLLRDSTFSPAGLARLERRLGLPGSGHSEAS